MPPVSSPWRLPARRRLLWRAVVLAIVVSACGRDAFAQGQCSVPAGASADFGTATSFEVAGASRATMVPVVGSCTGSLLNVLVLIGDPPYFRATIGGSPNNFRLTNGAGDYVPYSLFADPSHAFPIVPGVQFNYYQPTLLDALGLLGGSMGDLPLHVRTDPAGPIAAGTYTDTFTIDWSWRICNLGVVVCLGYTEGTGTTVVTVTMTVTAACQVTSAPDVSFGSAPVAAAFSSVAQSITVLCTKGVDTHSVGLSAGLHEAGGRRHMAGPGGMLAYDIFKQPEDAVWGFAGAARFPASGAADGVTPQSFPYIARVYPDQPTPGVGVYSDVIVIEVLFD